MRIRSCVLAVLVAVGSMLLAERSLMADELSDYAQMERTWKRLYEGGRYQDAENLAAEMLTISRRSFPNYVFADLSRVGMCRVALAKYPEALEYLTMAFQEAAKFRPQNEGERQGLITTVSDIVINLGLCNFHMANFEEAQKWFEQTISWNEKFPIPAHQAQATSLLASTFWKLGERDKAHETFRKADALLRRMVAQESRPGQATYLLAITQRSWATIYKEAGRYDIAEPMLRNALQLFINSVGWNHGETATCADTLASAYFQQGRIEDARPLLLRAIEIKEGRLGFDHPRTLIAVGKLGDVFFVERQFAKAEALYRRMIDGYERRLGNDHPDLCSPLWMLGRCLAMADREAESEPFFERAVAISQKKLGPAHTVTAMALTWLAWGKTQVLKPDEALQRANEVLEIHRQNPLAYWMLIQAHSIRSATLWATGKKQEAIEEQNKVIQLSELERWQSGGGEAEQAVSFEGNLMTYSRMVGWQVELGKLDQVFQTIDAMKARTFLDELASRGTDPLVGLSATEKAEKRQRETELRAAVTVAEQELAALPESGPNPSADRVAQRHKAAGKLLAARDSLYQYMAELRKSSPAYRQLINRDRQAITLESVQKTLLEPNDLLLIYQIGDLQSFVMAIRRDQAVVHELKVDDPTAKALQVSPGPLTQETLLRVLVSSPESVVPSLSDSARAKSKNDELAALYKLLVPAAEHGELVGGKVGHLFIVPDGPLGLLPFETLIVSNASEPQYLLDAGPPMAYAPSASVLLNLAGRKPVSASAIEPVLTLGNPVYQAVTGATSDVVDRVRTSVSRLRAGLAPLPFTDWESAWVQEVLAKAGVPSKRLTRAEATEAAIRREAPGRQIVHLACHGMADQSYGNFFGSLAVTPGKAGDPRDDGFLTMSEIYALNLNGCELAILSACQTNYGPQQWGEGVWALSRGFLLAGARRVIASNWVVDDEAGATLISHFTSYAVRDGKDLSSRDYAAALHEAKKKIRKNEKWSSPFYWGSLVLMGPR